MSKAIKKIKEETLGVLVEAPKLNFAAEDLDAPRLNVVQAQSKIAGETGDLVIDKLYTLVKHEEECKAIPINAIKGWREDTPFGHPEMPRQVFTEEEAKELAKNSDFNVIPFAEIIFLFPKNDNADEDAFPFPIGDDFYALGKINVAKDAFKFTYKRLATFQLFNSTSPICIKVWKFKTELLTKGVHSYFVPSVTPTTEYSPEGIAEFASTLT